MVKSLPKRARASTKKVWVSKIDTKIDMESLDDLQKTFAGRLCITRGNNSETIIASQPQDWGRLCEIMRRGPAPFSEQVLYM